MAFRGYELNLILRVQDRATARLRRISSDIGGLQRASQIQRDMNRVNLAQNRNAINQGRILDELNSRQGKYGEINLRNQSKFLRLKAQETTLQDRLSRMNPARNPAQYSAAYRRLQAVQKDLVNLEMSSARAVGMLNAELRQAVGEQAALNAEAAALARNYEIAAAQERRMARARSTAHAGSVAFMAGGIGLIAAGGVSSAFANFNRQSVAAATQMRGVNETFTATVAISKTLETALLDLTRTFPASAQEMSEAIYDIASGMNFQIDRTSKLTETQQRFNQSMKILRYANKVAVAGNLDLKTATDVLITTFNNFDPAVRSPIKRLNELFAIVRFGKGTFADFAPQIGRMASAANAAGQSLTEAGAALAFLSQRLPLSQATTALVRIFQIIGRKEFTTGFQELFKISPLREGTRRLKNLSDLMFIIEKQGPKIWPGFKKGSVDLMNVLQNITAAGQNALKGTTDAVGLQSTEFARRAVTNFIVFGDQYRDTLRDVTGTQGEFFRSFQAFRNQPGVQWQIAINQFKAFAIILGQDVLPVMLRFIGFVTDLSHKFENLSPSTRRLIANFATWGSIALFVGGAITSILGGIGILVARLGGLGRILGVGGGAGVVGRLTVMQRILRSLLAIGTITIGIELIKKGDQSLWSTILGGAAQVGGAAFLGSKVAGWQGAVIAGAFAAYSIPLQMAAAEMKKQGAVSRDTINKELQRIENFKKAVEGVSGGRVAGRAAERARTILIRAVYRQEGLQGIKNTEKYMKTTLGNMQQDLLDYAKNTGVSHMFYQGHREVLNQLDKQNTKTTDSILQHWRDLATELTGLDFFGGASQQMAEKASMISLAVAKAAASGSDAKLRAALQAQIAFDKREIARLERLPKTAARVKALTQLYEDQATATGKIESMNKANAKATTAQNKAAEVQRNRNEAQREQTNKISQAVDNLAQKYKELEQANKKAFEVFTGPISQGPIAQIYDNINKILMGFGRRPIAIPIKLQLQDITAQVTNFKRFVEDIAILRRRGLPQQLLDELQAKGPTEALPLLEGLRSAGRGAVNQYVSQWKQGQKLIKTTTDKQMAATLKQWNQYGKDVAWQIVQGLADDKTQATLKAGYKKYITDTFKGVLAKELGAAVAAKTSEYDKVQTAKGKKTGTARKTATKPEPTRTTQSHTTITYHGDEIQVTASGATASAVKAALDRAAFDKRNRR